jgi:hypothetical protein
MILKGLYYSLFGERSGNDSTTTLGFSDAGGPSRAAESSDGVGDEDDTKNVLPSRSAFEPDGSSDVDPVHDPSVSSLVDQTQVRYRDVGSGVRIHGSLWMAVPDGQRDAVACVGFCPPFCEVPELEAEQTSGPAASVVVSRRLWHGAQIEVRLDQPAEGLAEIQLEYVATSGGMNHPKEAARRNGSLA